MDTGMACTMYKSRGARCPGGGCRGVCEAKWTSQGGCPPGSSNTGGRQVPPTRRGRLGMRTALDDASAREQMYLDREHGPAHPAVNGKASWGSLGLGASRIVAVGQTNSCATRLADIERMQVKVGCTLPFLSPPPFLPRVSLSLTKPCPRTPVHPPPQLLLPRNLNPRSSQNETVGPEQSMPNIHLPPPRLNPPDPHQRRHRDGPRSPAASQDKRYVPTDVHPDVRLLRGGNNGVRVLQLPVPPCKSLCVSTLDKAHPSWPSASVLLSSPSVTALRPPDPLPCPF